MGNKPQDTGIESETILEKLLKKKIEIRDDRSGVILTGRIRDSFRRLLDLDTNLAVLISSGYCYGRRFKAFSTADYYFFFRLFFLTF